jgi:RHS repeat-associated protein
MNRKVLLLAVGLLFFTVGAFAQMDANLERGLKPFGSYSGGNVDTVSLTSGNLFVHIPFWSYAQRGGKLGWNYFIQYNHKHFNIKEFCDPTGEDCRTYIMYRPAIYKKGMQIVRQEAQSIETESIEYSPGMNATYSFLVTSDDSRHGLAPLQGSPSVYRTIDASGYLKGSVIIDRNGVRGTTQDPNGNTTDTLGRTPVTTNSTTDYSGCTGPRAIVSATAWNMLVQGAGRVPVKLCYATVHLKTGFAVTDYEFEANKQFLQSIVLPNGTAWTFEYADLGGGYNYGDLTKLTFPTGGSLAYTWTSVEYSRWVTTRTVDANDGGGPRTWTYSWAVPNVGIVVTDPVGNDSVHNVAPFGSDDCKYEVEAKAYEGSHASGSLLKTVRTDYSWSTTPFVLGPCYSSVVEIRTTTIWPNGLQTKVEKDYDAGFIFVNPIPQGGGPWTGTFGNVVQQREYAYGTGAPGALVRKTETAYLALTNSGYRDNNLIDLVSSVTVRDGAGTQKALTTYAYDTQALQASGVTVGFTTSPPNHPYRGNLTSVSRWLNTTGGYITSTTKYWDTGMVYQQFDPLSHLTTTEYSLTFHGAYPTRVTNHLGHQVNMAYDFSTGLLTSSTDPNNRTTSYTYDTLSRPDLITAPDSGWVNFDYTDSAPFKVTITAQIDATKNLVTEGEVDGVGRLRFTRLTSDPLGTVYTRTDYDALGRKQFEWNPTRCNITVGTPPGSCSGESTYGKTETQYDALGRVSKLIPPDGTGTSNNITTAYAANCTTVTDQAGKQRRSCSDALGRLIQVDEPFPTLSTPAATLYTYDALDNLVCVEQHGGVTGTGCASDPVNDATSPWRVRRFTYDSLSRLTQAKNPESGIINYTYDNDSNLITKVDERGITTCYGTWTGTTCSTSPGNEGYDELHRLKKKTYSDSTPTATFTYDANSVDGLSITNPVGRLVKAATNNTRTVQSYDEMGRVVTQWQCVPSNCGMDWFSATYTYTKLSGVTSQSNPMGFTLTQGYNAAARLIGITSNWNDETHPPALLTADAAQGHHPHGALKLGTLGNGLAESAAYNSRLQPTEMRTYDPGPGTDKLKLTYSFVDANGKNNGNVMSWVGTGALAFSRTYLYDELNRIQAMASPGESCVGLNWTYDIWANRTNQSGAGGSCQEHHPTVLTNNRISELGYDTAGNTTSNGSTTYQYDAENRLVSLNGGGGNNPEYLYDANGRRVRKKIGSTLTEFIYDVAGMVVAERESTNGGASWTWTKGYAYVGSQMLVQYSGVIGAPGATTLFAHKDHLGSTRLLTKWDKSFDPSDVYDYLPYGESASTGSSTHKFTGKERDSESNLDYFGARYYSSNLGRFSSPDEFTSTWGQPYTANDEQRGNPMPFVNLNNPLSLNKYSYVYNNPLLFVDPFGHDVRVSLYPGARGFGHVGIGVGQGAANTRTRGLYPHPDANQRDVARGATVRGQVRTDAGRVEQTIVLRTTPEQDRQIREFLDNAQRNSPNYDLNDNNCADFVRQALAAGGIEVRDVVRPQALMDNVEQLAVEQARQQTQQQQQNNQQRPNQNQNQDQNQNQNSNGQPPNPSNLIPDQLRGSKDGANAGIPKRR